jgi:hypothetical protein
MEKRLARVVLGLMAAGLALAGLWPWGGIVSNALGEDKKGGYLDSCMVVVGDSTSYQLCNYVLPGTSDTSAAFNVNGADMISVRAFGSGDSLAYWIDYTFDGLYWTNLVDSTFVNSAPELTWTPTTNNWRFLFNNQLAHDQVVGTAHGPTYRNWMLDKIRVRVENVDVSDTLFNLRYRVLGETR